MATTRTAVGAVAAVVLAGLLVTVRGSASGAAAELRDLEPGMAIIDAASGELVAHIPTSTVTTPAEAIFAEVTSGWSISSRCRSCRSNCRPAGSSVRSSPTEDAGAYTVADGNLWITEYLARPHKVDVELGQVVERWDDLPGPAAPGGVIVADGSLWVARRDAGLGIVARLDPETGEVNTCSATCSACSLSYGDDGAVWTGGTWGHVNRIDPLTNTVTSGNVGGRNFFVAARRRIRLDDGRGQGRRPPDRQHRRHRRAMPDQARRPRPLLQRGRRVGRQPGRRHGQRDRSRLGRRHHIRVRAPIQAVAAGAGTVVIQLVAGRPFDDDVTELDGDVAKFFVGGYQLDPTNPDLVGGDLAPGRALRCAGLLRQRGRRAAARGRGVNADGVRRRTATTRSRSGRATASRRPRTRR